MSAYGGPAAPRTGAVAQGTAARGSTSSPSPKVLGVSARTCRARFSSQ